MERFDPYRYGYILLLSFIIVKNTCVSHNNPFAGKRRGRHVYISLLQNLIIALCKTRALVITSHSLLSV